MHCNIDMLASCVSTPLYRKNNSERIYGARHSVTWRGVTCKDVQVAKLNVQEIALPGNQ